MDFQSQKTDANLQLSYKKLEALAFERKQLKIALESSESIDSKNVIMSSGTSFLLLNGGDASILLRKKLTKVEDELRFLCQEIQEGYEEKNHAGDEDE